MGPRGPDVLIRWDFLGREADPTVHTGRNSVSDQRKSAGTLDWLGWDSAAQKAAGSLFGEKSV
jgi:hypothetical protein